MSELAVEVAGGLIGAWRAGSGPPALVVHGGPGINDTNAELAEELAPIFDTIRYQQRGLPPTTLGGPYDVETSVADALALLDALGIRQAWLVGHSWGGHLAMHLAVAAPERVLGLVAVDPLGAVPDGGEADLERSLAERLPDDVSTRVDELDARLLRGEGSTEDGLELLRLVWPYYFDDPAHAPPMPESAMNAEAYADTWDSIRAHFERGTLARGLPELDLPAVFVLGAGSPIPVVHGERSAALVRGAHVEIVDGAGHFPWLERPGCVRRAVERVLA